MHNHTTLARKHLRTGTWIVRENPIDQEKTPAEVFGEMESWIFHLGEYRLFLNPINGMWFWYDRVHDDWRDSKFTAGTVIFSLDGDNLQFLSLPDSGKDRKQPGEVPQARGKNFCGQCGSPISPGKNFCPNCGKPVS